jgi:hypothetical protein
MTTTAHPLAAEAAALRIRLLAHAEQAEARPGLVLTAAALDDLNAAVSLLAVMARTLPAERGTTPAERRRASHRMCKPANRLRNVAALLAR